MRETFSHLRLDYEKVIIILLIISLGISIWINIQSSNQINKLKADLVTEKEWHAYDNEARDDNTHRLTRQFNQQEESFSTYRDLLDDIVIGDQKVYIDPEQEYYFLYPSDFQLDPVSDQTKTQVFVTSSDNPSDFFELRITKQTVSLSDEYFQDLTVNGYPAAINVFPNGYCDGPACGESPPVISVAILKDNTTYAFWYRNKTSIDGEFQQLLDSFHFINEN